MASFLRICFVVLAFLAVTGCAGKFRTYSGPPVTLVEVYKADRKIYLLSGDKILKTYNMSLGRNPIGPKQFEGDMKTPEGSYYITHRNPNSQYYLSIGISYPNQAQIDYAKSQGKEPGGDIFIHGANTRGSSRGDWTAGCIAVSNRDIEEIYAMVNPGTPINIFP